MTQTRFALNSSKSRKFVSREFRFLSKHCFKIQSYAVSKSQSRGPGVLTWQHAGGWVELHGKGKCCCCFTRRPGLSRKHPGSSQSEMSRGRVFSFDLGFPISIAPQQINCEVMSPVAQQTSYSRGRRYSLCCDNWLSSLPVTMQYAYISCCDMGHPLKYALNRFLLQYPHMMNPMQNKRSNIKDPLESRKNQGQLAVMPVGSCVLVNKCFNLPISCSLRTDLCQFPPCRVIWKMKLLAHAPLLLKSYLLRYPSQLKMFILNNRNKNIVMTLWQTLF